MPSSEAIAVLRELHEHLRSGSERPEDPRTFLEYKQVHDQLNLDLVADTYGDSLKRQGLLELAEWAKAQGLPAVTGLVNDRDKLHPGDGYLELHGLPATSWQWWFDQIADAIAFDWGPYVLR